MVGITDGLPSGSILAIIMVLTMCLSDIINNAATALIIAPISVRIAVGRTISCPHFARGKLDLCCQSDKEFR